MVQGCEAIARGWGNRYWLQGVSDVRQGYEKIAGGCVTVCIGNGCKK